MAAAERVLEGVFGFRAFRPGQAAVVEAVLAGRDVLAVMPTGSGKSLCYQVPALVLGGLTVVVSPLVALMQDQVAALRLAGVAADAINSSRARADNVAAWRRAAAGETRLLYMAPERLMTERMLAALAELPVTLFAVDEAHCVSQWGPAFRPEYEALGRLRELFAGAPIAALTATADEITRGDIAAKLLRPDARVFVSGFDRPNIRLSVAMKRDWKGQLVRYVEQRKGASGIVYCLSRKKTEAAAELLAAAGVTALPYHAGMDKAAREANQDRFMSEAGVVMVATIAFGMGIDKADVRFVLHTDLPGNVEAYYQEIGRAGRDGAPADAHMLYGLDDIRMRRRFIEQDGGGDERLRREHKRLDALIGYCESPRCRRRLLLAYFGEDAGDCGNCDMCLDPVELVDGAEDAAKVLDAVLRTGQLFGAAHITDILCGARTEKVVRSRHDRLAAFGAGADHGKEDWRSIIRQMVAAGLLLVDIAGHGGLSATGQGRAVVDGRTGFRYRRDAMPQPARRRAKAAPAEAPAAGAPSRADEALLQALKALRLRLARERGVPAYVIFPDRSLVDMVRRRPGTAAEFAVVDGVGEVKLRAFADAFLAAIAVHG
ncbi:MAG TPA: DNA helicase RecQ [Alphaproteobacteria bacterium]